MRTIRLHDTLTGEERPLEPRDPGKAGIYACGPTVYSRIHVGNARPYVVYSLLKRFLEHEGYDVTLVVNVTDVNDKIYAAAREHDVTSEELAREMTAHYVDHTDRLGLGRPDSEPLASETIDGIVDLIQALLDGGHAYESGGDVYFRVASHEGYGKLSNRELDDMDQGEEDSRVTMALKESPHDFALWKAQKPGEDTAWDAPWGRGRPGWHIECSAMAEHILGLDFDIHGGGSDLIFPHHENEIAQTEAGRGRPLARLWMHNGMIRIEGEKMAKSVGNIFQLSEALDTYGRDTLVMYLVGGHYRKPLAFSPDALTDASARVDRVREFCRRLDPDAPQPDALAPFEQRFFDRLADDFDTAGACRGELFGWIAEGNRRLDGGETLGVGAFRDMLWALGLEGLLDCSAEEVPAEVRRLVDERQAARDARDFETADAKRDESAALGWVVRDTPEGPRIERA
ncbi:MAG: cysteine--tRNA ligase [Thermoleophilaceae bacterium]